MQPVLGYAVVPTNTDMSQRTTRQIIRGGQGVLEGLEPQLTSIDLTERQTFSGAAVPENFGIVPRHLEAGELSRVHMLDSERLLPDLIDVGKDSPASVRYYDYETRRACYVALTPEEYGQITLSPQKLGERAVNKTLASRPARADFTADQAAADRSAVHAIAGRMEGSQVYIDQLKSDQDLINRFAEYVKNPNLQRLRGDNLLQQMAWFQEHVIGSIFLVLQQQRGWKPDQLEAAKQAMDDRLFLDRAKNHHLSNWQDTLLMAHTYWGYKIAVFKTNREALSQEIKRRQLIT